MHQKDEIAQHMTSMMSSSGNVQSRVSGPITCNILYHTPSVQNGQSKLYWDSTYTVHLNDDKNVSMYIDNE